MKKSYKLYQIVCLCSMYTTICCGTGCNIQTDTIRLVGGLSDQGLVEICAGNNQWMSVCDFLWTDMKAEIVCRELNLAYSGAQAFSGGGCSAFNMSTSDEGIFIQCTGEERSITECTRAALVNCITAGVICRTPCDPSFCSGSNSQCLPPTSTCSCPTPSNTNCTCNEAVCSPACLNGGTCTAPGECLCPPGWTGYICQHAICDPFCFNGGNCTGPDTCQCPDTWEGDNCQQAICNPPCSNGGNCIGPGTCQCPDTWEGDHCQQGTEDYARSFEDSTTSSDSSSIPVPVFVVVIIAVVLAVAWTVLGVLSALWRRKAMSSNAYSTSARPSTSANDALAYEQNVSYGVMQPSVGCKENVSYGVLARNASADYEEIAEISNA